MEQSYFWFKKPLQAVELCIITKQLLTSWCMTLQQSRGLGLYNWKIDFSSNWPGLLCTCVCHSAACECIVRFPSAHMCSEGYSIWLVCLSVCLSVPPIVAIVLCPNLYWLYITHNLYLVSLLFIPSLCSTLSNLKNVLFISITKHNSALYRNGQGPPHYRFIGLLWAELFNFFFSFRFDTHNSKGKPYINMKLCGYVGFCNSKRLVILTYL